MLIGRPRIASATSPTPTPSPQACQKIKGFEAVESHQKWLREAQDVRDEVLCTPSHAINVDLRDAIEARDREMLDAAINKAKSAENHGIFKCSSSKWYA